MQAHFVPALTAVLLVLLQVFPAAVVVSKGVKRRSCRSNAGPTPHLFDITCYLQLPDSTGPRRHDHTLIAVAGGSDWLAENKVGSRRWTPQDALARFGCDVRKTELGPLIQNRTVDISKVVFYHLVHAHHVLSALSNAPLNITTGPKYKNSTALAQSPTMTSTGVVANIFIADYAVQQSGGKSQRVAAIGFCNYWPEVNSTNADWDCKCESKSPPTPDSAFLPGI